MNFYLIFLPPLKLMQYYILYKPEHIKNTLLLNINKCVFPHCSEQNVFLKNPLLDMQIFRYPHQVFEQLPFSCLVTVVKLLFVGVLGRNWVAVGR